MIRPSDDDDDDDDGDENDDDTVDTINKIKYFNQWRIQMYCLEGAN